MTTWTPLRYPAGHPDAGAIILDPDDDALATEPAAPAETPKAEDRTPKPATPATSGAAAAPRRLSELMPGAATPKPPKTRDALTTGAIALVAVGLLVWGATRQAPPSAPPALPTAQVPTVLVPTAPPTVDTAPAVTAMPPNTTVRALVAYFDYRDESTATPLERGVAYEPIGRAGDRWLLVRVGGAEVWALAEDLGAVVDTTLPDLTPRAPVYVPPAAPAYVPPAAPAACVEVVIGLDVSDAAGVPLGHVEGVGCTVADAQANAEQLSAELRASRAPTPAPTADARR